MVLFSRRRPGGLTTQSTARSSFSAFEGAKPEDELYQRNLDAIRNNLTKTHRSGAFSDGRRASRRFTKRSTFEDSPSATRRPMPN